MNWKKAAAWVAFIAVSVAIFLLSAQPAEESAALSGGLLEQIINQLVPDFASLPQEEQAETFLFCHTIIREAAHYVIYVLWGGLLTALLCIYRVRGIWLALLTAVLGFLYAAGDELHQAFVPGRSFQWLDILLDFAGSVTGCAAVCGIRGIWRRRRPGQRNTKYEK